MKRTFSIFDGSQDAAPAGATPRNLIPRPTLGPGGTGAARSTKRVRQTTLKSFLNVDTPTDKDTPTLMPGLRQSSTSAQGECSNVEWPSTAQRALENLRVNTPGLPSIGHEVARSQHFHEEEENSRQYADTCLHKPAASLGGATGYDDFGLGDDEDDFGGGFRISSSQSYFRPPTQLDPSDERSISWGEAWEERDQGPQQRTTFALGSTAAPSCLPQDVDDSTSVLTQAVDQADNHAQSSQRVTPLQGGGSAGLKSTSELRASHAANHEVHADVLGGNTTGRHCSGRMEQAVTPELAPVLACEEGVTHADDGDQDDEPPVVAMVPKPLAALFRPRNERKLLLVVRHGESEYNRAVSESKSYADPLIFDPKLTQKGVNQCKELQRKLASMLSDKLSEYGEPVWVISPLTRALQTFMLGCPYPERIGQQAAAAIDAWVNATSTLASQGSSNMQHMWRSGISSGAGASTSRGTGGATSSSASNSRTMAQRMQIEVLPSISEFMATPGDVGRPPAALVQDFPQLSEELSRLPEQWWYKTTGKQSCALTQRWEGAEPTDRRKQRVQEFSRWLAARRERLFVLVGHSCFWHQFMGKQHSHLKNCEVMSMTW